MLLQEAYYFGKNKELLQIEKMLQIIIDRVKENALYIPTGTKENKEIELSLCKIFNFEKCSLNWETSAFSNAYTIPSVFVPITDGYYDIVKSNDGIKFKNSKSKIIYIKVFTSLITISDLTADELLAIILHEVGHNFYNTQYLKFFKPFIMFVSLLIHLISILKITDDNKRKSSLTNFLGNQLPSLLSKVTPTGKKIVINIKELDNQMAGGLGQKTINILRAINSVLSDLLNVISVHLNAIAVLVNPVLIPLQAISNVTFTLMTDSYRNEKFADNFTAMYGYGSSLSNAMLKFDKGNTTLATKTLNSIPIMGAYYSTLTFFVRSTLSIGECHPVHPTRMKEQKKLLEEFLNENNVDKKIKADILKQISDIDEIYEKLYNSAGDNKNLVIVEMIKKATRQMGIKDDDVLELIWTNNNYNWDNVLKQNM